jgi:hypothetical protein
LIRWTKAEIREQLVDLGAFHGEVLEEHSRLLEKAEQRLADAEATFLKSTRKVRADLRGQGAEHRRQMDHIERATAEWSARAVVAGLTEGEILELLRLPHPRDLPARKPGDV